MNIVSMHTLLSPLPFRELDQPFLKREIHSPSRDGTERVFDLDLPCHLGYRIGFVA